VYYIGASGAFCRIGAIDRAVVAPRLLFRKPVRDAAGPKEETGAMKWLYITAGSLVIATLLSGCSGNDAAPSPTPTPTPTPTPNTPAVNTVVVTSSQTSASSYQLKADARLADGSSHDVTTSSLWQSSNVNVAQVSPAGVVTVMAAGQVDMRATYQNVTGSLGLTVTMPPPSSGQFMLTGYVSEAPPVSKLFEGVKITVTSGPDAGQFTYTNETGYFRFGRLTAGIFSLAINHAGYQPWTFQVHLDSDVNLPIVLYPVPPVDASGATATARCRDASWSWAKDPMQACVAQGGIAYPVCPGPLC